MNKFTKNKQFAISVILLSVSLILGYIEAVIPLNIGLLGIKLGLPNIISILGIKTVGVKKTFTINILRLIILGVLFSNLIRFLISVSGFVISFLVMSIALSCLKFRIITSSMFGGVFHNIGQLICVSIITSNISVYNLLPVYIIIGGISGVVIGVISYKTYEIIKRYI